jgi:undecaprenyl-diphosphatase
MNIFESILLGVIQGITEFLPISSSGHLVFFQDILGLPVAELLTFDIALHAGSLGAIVVYFWKDWKQLFFQSLQDIQSIMSLKKSLIMKLAAGTLPAVIFALLFKDILEAHTRSMTFVAVMWIILGFILFQTKKFAGNRSDFSYRDAIYIGVAQMLALFPGISRSGMTITTGMALGIKRKDAAMYSFFLGAIAIFGAMVLMFFDTDTSTLLPQHLYIGGFISSFVSSLASVYVLMKILVSQSLRPFSYYVWAMGIGTLVYTLILES